MGEKIHQWTNDTRNGFINAELDALWAAVNALGGAGAGVEYPTFTTSAPHGFAVGDFVGLDTGGDWALAGGGTDIDAIARVMEVPTTTTFTAAGPGMHSAANSLAIGKHYLSDVTAGATTTTVQIGGPVQIVMYVVSGLYVILFPTEGIG